MTFEEEMKLWDKYIGSMESHLKEIQNHTKTIQLCTSRTMLHCDTMNAEIKHLIPGFFSFRPRRSIGRFIQEIYKAEARQKGRDLVIEHGSKWFG